MPNWFVADEADISHVYRDSKTPKGFSHENKDIYYILHKHLFLLRDWGDFSDQALNVVGS